MKEDFTITARDGFEIAATLYYQEESRIPTPIVIMAPAMGVKRTFYDKFARKIASDGFRVVTFDFRGIGGSAAENIRKDTSTLHNWGLLDMTAVIDWAATAAGGQQVFLIGHSVAGQIFPLAKNRQLVNAACFVASVSAYWKLWRGFDRIKIFLFFHVIIPFLTTTFGYLPGKLFGSSVDLPYGVAREWAKWGKNPQYVLSFRPTVQQNFQDISIPLLFLTFTDDKIAPKKPALALQKWYGTNARKHVHISPKDIGVKSVGHFGFFREKMADALWQPTIAWLHGQKEKISVDSNH